MASTHGLFTGPAVSRLEAEPTDEIVITDTVPLSPDKHLSNLVIHSVAPLFAETVRRINCGESVSSLFNEESASH